MAVIRPVLHELAWHLHRASQYIAGVCDIFQQLMRYPLQRPSVFAFKVGNTFRNFTPIHRGCVISDLSHFMNSRQQGQDYRIQQPGASDPLAFTSQPRQRAHLEMDSSEYQRAGNYEPTAGFHEIDHQSAAPEIISIFGTRSAVCAGQSGVLGRELTQLRLREFWFQFHCDITPASCRCQHGLERRAATMKPVTGRRIPRLAISQAFQGGMYHAGSEP